VAIGKFELLKCFLWDVMEFCGYWDVLIDKLSFKGSFGMVWLLEFANC
jgi:hypothetical protein